LERRYVAMPTIDEEIRRSLQVAARRLPPAHDMEDRLQVVERRGARARSSRYLRNAVLSGLAVAVVLVVGSRLVGDLRVDHVPATTTPSASPIPSEASGVFVVHLDNRDAAVRAAGTAGRWTVILRGGAITFLPPSTFASSPIYADYTIDGDTLTTSALQGSRCDGAGTYRWSRTEVGLSLEAVDEPCPDRESILGAFLAAREATPLDGMWNTGTISSTAQAAAITSSGFPSRFADAFARDMGNARSLRYWITLQDGQYMTAVSVDGGTGHDIDKGTYEVQGDRLTLRPFGGGATTFRYTTTDHLDGRRLALELVDDTQPDYRGIPNEVFVTGIYLAAPFSEGAG
jgi:hypothetical protein